MGKTAGIQDRHADPLPGKSGRFLLMSLNICLIHINYLYPSSEAGIQAGFSANIPVICIPDIKLPEQGYLDKTEAVLDSLEDVIDYVKGQEWKQDQ